MTGSVDYIVDTPDGQHSITITPINVMPVTDMLYATGQYGLSEGDVGVGTITFDTNQDWSFDGISELSEEDIAGIAQFIKKIDKEPAALQENEPLQQDTETDQQPTSPQTFAVIVDDNGTPVDVQIVINYPFYDVTVAGTKSAQLEQDHHSNWFVTQGDLDDSLVQQIGRRITDYVTA